MIDLDAYDDRLSALIAELQNPHARAGVAHARAALREMRAAALPAPDAPSMPPMNHTPTTQAMRAAAWPRSGSLRAQIVDHLDGHPMTDDALEAVTGRSHQSVSAARHQLVADGWVEKALGDNGPVEHETRSGNPAQVWRLTRAAKGRRLSDGLAAGITAGIGQATEAARRLAGGGSVDPER